MGDKTITDLAEPRLKSFYPPFIVGINLPHQGVVDSYNPPFVAGVDLPHQGVVDSYNLIVLYFVYDAMSVLYLIFCLLQKCIFDKE